MEKSLASLRQEYSSHTLDESEVPPSPIILFEKWFQEALDAGVVEPNAMTLSTVDESGKPSARVVLLKAFGSEGFSFFTNFESRKGVELRNNPAACMTFWWQELERQVRVDGFAGPLPREELDRYFAVRPRPSQLGAWASPQSRVVSSRAELDAQMNAAAKKFENGDVPRPDYWGGYLITPTAFEFWQGRPSRLHDRICYEKLQDGHWNVFRRAP